VKPTAISADVLFEAFRGYLRWEWVAGLGASERRFDEVAVRAARTVPLGFEPRRHNLHKRYRYRLLLDPVRDPLERTRAWRVGHPLDLDRMRSACDVLVGTHDFAAFQGARAFAGSTVRTVHAIEWDDGHATGIFSFSQLRTLAGAA
jgi:tRNA pseudouridine(38-40) synthase